MNTTPRTNRMAKLFGLTDDRLLQFTDTTNTTPDSKMLTSLRRSASQLFYSPPAVHQTSAVAHLGKRRQFVLALDGPGILQDPWAYPLSWSSTNVIAVACGHDVYYQNLDTRQIAHLCNLPRPSLGRIRTLAFAPVGPSAAFGTTTGSIQVWDAASRRRVRSWPNTDWMSVSVLAWRPCSRLFTIGKADGQLALLDVRAPDEVHKFRGHRGCVYGMQWSHDERFMVSADAHGTVHLWDARNMSARVGKMKHDSPVKVGETSSIQVRPCDLQLTNCLLWPCNNNRPWRGVRGSPIYSLQAGRILMGGYTSGALPCSPVHYRQIPSRRSRLTAACTPYNGHHTRGSYSVRMASRGTPASACQKSLNPLRRHTPTRSASMRSPAVAVSSASLRIRAPSARAALARMELWFSLYATARRR